ncbi:hypothetical protein M885DRAFT_530756 [Pelagophyceae sp. CCMP2097]|nr:hypothetical protein M885DRAFT_530756 [Pelagophyceae sp. CCMP2097]|mmetsp:Transcript_20255/g.68621  ORF Transcript_20255/g.68621 Transcript_20255/m.68621 type:complete len:353 (+) Transcript_20255:200-1258(+)|eukprot:CAMPEP_0184087644 /NCGR_PEP_ID=MMETSP0974-20121125/5823_1 /TAXON_ID=483370 /ORGANISM="non described non described, Strain CCMP2097" /LENGTH=352 /DNA_ID=CAMNT_0026390347 /DNA_START=116 /DNA_END=1174 /DNA_ORIENTATION=+
MSRLNERAGVGRRLSEVAGSPKGAPTSSGLTLAPGGSVENKKLLTCLVTPKLSFSIALSPEWRTAKDIPQEALRCGLASRLPVGSALPGLKFEPVGGSAELRDADMAVFRLTSDDEADERVLLSLLREIERVYANKNKAALDQARTDMLSSSMTFQVLADEIRVRQGEAQAKHDRESRAVRDSLQTTSKRLFLLEQEKESLTKTVHASEVVNGRMRKTVETVAAENAELHGRVANLERQLTLLLDAGFCLPAAPANEPKPPQPSAATQTELLVVSQAFIEPRRAAKKVPAAAPKPSAVAKPSAAPKPNVALKSVSPPALTAAASRAPADKNALNYAASPYSPASSPPTPPAD